MEGHGNLRNRYVCQLIPSHVTVADTRRLHTMQIVPFHFKNGCCLSTSYSDCSICSSTKTPSAHSENSLYHILIYNTEQNMYPCTPRSISVGRTYIKWLKSYRISWYCPEIDSSATQRVFYSASRLTPCSTLLKFSSDHSKASRSA